MFFYYASAILVISQIVRGFFFFHALVSLLPHFLHFRAIIKAQEGGENIVTTYRIDTSSLSPDEYERFYDAVDRFAFMICVGKPHILEVTWDENEPLEKLVPIPPGCLWDKF